MSHVMVVDDNITNIDVLFEPLEEAGFELSVATNGENALRQIPFADPDIILLDVLMPDIDGFEVCRRLKADPQTANIPIIFMTALTEMTEKIKGFNVGAVDYVTKPLQHEEVLMRLKTHLKVQELQRKLEKANQELEQRVHDRTHRLEVLSALSAHLNKIFDLDHLLDGLVNQVKNSFHYYQVHLYLLAEDKTALYMVKGSGEIGHKLKEQNHTLPLDTGIIGQVVRTHQPYVTNDVKDCPYFWRNPFLPNTQSELAVPLRNRNEIIGVLDIQSDQLNFFNETDLEMLQMIADQTVIAIHNAQLLAERQQTIAKLKQLDRLKTEFLTTMSHELRTPLNSIIGFADVLLQGIDGELNEYAQQDVQLIYNSGQHLLTLINDVLDLSKIEAGLMELHPIPLNAAELVTEVIDAAQILAKNKNIDLNYTITPNMSLVYGDKTRLKQILMNLVDNGIKFTRQGSVVITIQPARTPKMAQFSIADTGIGISEEEQKRLFGRFQQADMSKTRLHGGMGIGLAICKQLIDMHGGQIWLESKLDVGSTFYFTIPTVT